MSYKVNMKLLNVEKAVLHELFIYKDGVLYWRAARGNRKAGAKAGAVTDRGYINIRIGDLHYKAHNLIWSYHHGEVPENFIVDHEDTDPTNNNINNLRLATFQENTNNSNKFKNTSSKYKGVSLNKNTGKWHAGIWLNNKSVHIGTYDTELEAHEAWCSVAKEAHGNFFNPGNNSPIK